MLAGCLVHPGLKVVLPLAPEPIVHQDGSTKNDCEKNALKRFLANLKREHPHLKLVLLLDGLYADGPTISLIRRYGWHFIIVARDGNHAALIEAVDALDRQQQVGRHSVTGSDGCRHSFRYANGVPLNASTTERVNVLDYVETGRQGQRHFWSWVTSLPLTEKTVEPVMRGGRCRWRVENETFNTLKNQGYHLEHSYGHGQQHLATNFGYLTFLAFLVDQVQQLGCPLFQQALKRARGVRVYLWKLIVRYFMSLLIDSWALMFQVITGKTIARPPVFDTS